MSFPKVLFIYFNFSGCQLIPHLKLSYKMLISIGLSNGICPLPAFKKIYNCAVIPSNFYDDTVTLF